MSITTTRKATVRRVCAVGALTVVGAVVIAVAVGSHARAAPAHPPSGRALGPDGYLY